VWYNDDIKIWRMNMLVKVKKLMDDAVMPKYGTEFSAGADLVNAGESQVIESGATVVVHTGIAMEIPVGYVGLVYARSGMATKRGLAPANKVGVIDSDYRGEIMVAIHNHGKEAQTVEHGERVAQIVITPYVVADFVEGDLDSTERGNGGFGSTGRK
jgi:dUTP pyrophosphatase